MLSQDRQRAILEKVASTASSAEALLRQAEKASRVAESAGTTAEHATARDIAAKLRGQAQMPVKDGPASGFARVSELLGGSRLKTLSAREALVRENGGGVPSRELLEPAANAARSERNKVFGARAGAGAAGAAALAGLGLGARALVRRSRSGLSGKQMAGIGAGALGAGGLAAMLAGRDKKSSVEDISQYLTPGSLAR